MGDRALPTALITAALCGGFASAALAQRITGTANYPLGRGIPAGSVLEVMLDDMSREGVPMVLAQVRVVDPGPSPVHFTLLYDGNMVRADGRYALRARIARGERTLQVADRVPLRDLADDVTLELHPYDDIQIASATGTHQVLGKKPATFAGTIPNADGPAIDVQIDFYEDFAFAMRRQIRDGRLPTDRIGRWIPSPDGNRIALEAGEETLIRYAIIDPNRIRPIDGNGTPLLPMPARDLVRSPGSDVIRPRLTLRGMFKIENGIGRLEECLTGRIWPIAREAQAESLAKRYAQSGATAGEEVFVAIDGEITARQRFDGPGLTATLVVERVRRFDRGLDCTSASIPLVDVDWAVIEVAGQPVALLPDQRPPRIRLSAGGTQFSGWSGCNAIRGTYERRSSELRFATAPGPPVTCDAGGLERAFLGALEETRSFRTIGGVLELYGAQGTIIARFETVSR